MSVLVEACVDAIDSALEAESGGAMRIELCGELLQGGVTPSAGLIGAVWERVEVPVFVLIRPRPGDFLYTHDEVDVMMRDIEVAGSLDADGIVVGALTTDGDVDVGTITKFIDAAGSMHVSFHRAFDYVRDQTVALEALVELGVDRILTSGGAANALEGAAQIRALREQAGDRIMIMAGGSITSRNVVDVVRQTGVHEVHVRAAGRASSGMAYVKPGITLARPQVPSQYDRYMTRESEMLALMDALDTA